MASAFAGWLEFFQAIAPVYLWNVDEDSAEGTESTLISGMNLHL